MLAAVLVVLKILLFNIHLVMWGIKACKAAKRQADEALTYKKERSKP